MSVVLKNIAGVVLGLVIGSFVNLGLVTIGPTIIASPPGVDATDAESLAASMHLFEARHFVFPFLAHALGTLVGALLAYIIAGSHRAKMAYVVGAAFFAGGIAASFMIPAPMWYIVVDLVFAYFPMAWLGQSLARRFVGEPGPPSTTS